MRYARTAEEPKDLRQGRIMRFVQLLKLPVQRKNQDTRQSKTGCSSGIDRSTVRRAPTGARTRVSGLLKLFVALMIVCAIAYLGLESRDGTLSRIARVPNLDATPGGARQRESPQYQDTLRRANDLNLERALVEGDSFVMVPEVVPEQIDKEPSTGTFIQGSPGQFTRHTNQRPASGADSEKDRAQSVSESTGTRTGSTTDISAAVPTGVAESTSADNSPPAGQAAREPEPYSIEAITRAAVSTSAAAKADTSSSLSDADSSSIAKVSEKDISALQQRMLAQMNAIAASIVVGPATSRILISDETNLHPGSASQAAQATMLIDLDGAGATGSAIGSGSSARLPHQSRPENARNEPGRSFSSEIDGSAIGHAMPGTIAAGTLLYGEVLNEVSSDLSVPILATITAGALSGWRLIGQFAVADNNSGLVVEFDKLVDPGGKTIPVEAMAIDGYEGQSIVSSKIDRRLMARYGPALAASFVNGLAQSAAQPRMAISSVGNSAVLVTDQASYRQSLYSGLEAASGLLASDLTANRPTGPRIVLSAGYPLGILFTSSAHLNSQD